jgi:uncharacterized membrane protein YfcA
MVGISGGAFKTPLLIIVFGLGAHISASVALFSALPMSIVSSFAYLKHRPNSILYRTGLILITMTIPGAIVGSLLKSAIVEDYVLRIIFGVCLFPIALKMLFAEPFKKPQEPGDSRLFIFGRLNADKKIASLLGAFIAGIVAGLLGLGGGTILVPLMCIVMGLPMITAAATSVFTMIFTTISGTISNIMLMTPSDTESFLVFSLAVGLGLVIGGHFGPMYACRISAIHLKRFFGVALVFPLVKMMEIGKLLFDPAGTNYTLEILGDVIIWLGIVIPIALLRIYQTRNEEIEECQAIVPQ